MLERGWLRLVCVTTAAIAVGVAVPALGNDSGENGAGFEETLPNDPWEGMNRKVFAFNEALDIWILRPVAVGWDRVMPDPVQTGLRNFFSNARFPVVFVNNLLQAKPLEAGKSLARFVLNTAFGVGGLLDPAREAGLEPSNEDFGQTLGYWGVPPGPFLVLPFLGPSSPRDAVGLAADSFAMVHPYFVAWYVSASLTATNVVNTRARYIEEIDENRRTALDFYAFQRNAYVDYRENLVHDREEDDDSTVEGEGLYFFDDDEDSDAGSGNDGG